MEKAVVFTLVFCQVGIKQAEGRRQCRRPSACFIKLFFAFIAFYHFSVGKNDRLSKGNHLVGGHFCLLL